jgi:hypothetical protein
MKTVEDAIAEVRSLCDESNTSTIDNVTDILPSLNRAQLYAFDLLSKHYEDPLLFPIYMTVERGVAEIDLPENIFEDRLQKIEYQTAGYYFECKRISYRDISMFEVPTTVPAPPYYCIYGRKIRFLPPPDGSYSIRMWAVREPEELVMPQGRISGIDTTAGSYIIVENAGTDLTTNTNSLNCYANIIDGQTGEIKQSLMISGISSSRITFKQPVVEDGDRTTVLNRSITYPLASTVAPDDYICVIKGSCVPILMHPLYNFLIQYAVNEMNRKLKNEFVDDKELLKLFADQVERTWSEREMTLRVQMKSKHWMPRRARRNTRRR